VRGLLNYGTYPLFQPSSSSLKGKIATQTDEKSHGKIKSHKETKAPVENCHHDPWWPLPHFEVSPWTMVCALDQPSWAY